MSDPREVSDLLSRVRTLLAGGHVHQALEVALAAAKEAGERAVSANHHLPPAEQFDIALLVADEILEGLAVELAAGEG